MLSSASRTKSFVQVRQRTEHADGEDVELSARLDLDQPHLPSSGDSIGRYETATPPPLAYLPVFAGFSRIALVPDGLCLPCRLRFDPYAAG